MAVVKRVRADNSFKLFDLDGLGQQNGIVMIRQSVNEPVPVVRGFDGDNFEQLEERLWGFQNDRQPVWQSFPEQLLIASLCDKIHHVVAMQVEAAEYFTADLKSKEF